MAKGIHLEADSTTQEFKLYHGRGGLYIGKAVLKNNVFVLDFVPDLGTADSDAIVNFTNWTPPPIAHDYLGAEEVGAASAPRGKRRSGKGGRGDKGGGGGGGGGGGAGGGGGGGGGGGCGSSGGGGGGGGGGGTVSGAGGSSGSGGGGSGGDSGGQGQQQPQQQQQQQHQQQQRQRQTPTSQQLLDWYAGRGVSGEPGRYPYIIRTGPRTGPRTGRNQD
ncbi:unnamed protein product [Closterium sp. NIES-53]